MASWRCLPALAGVQAQALTVFRELHAEPQSCACTEVNVELWRFISMDAHNDVPRCAMDDTMGEAGVSAVCERVRTGRRGLQFVCGATTAQQTYTEYNTRYNTTFMV